jgi:hypothetical protein
VFQCVAKREVHLGTKLLKLGSRQIYSPHMAYNLEAVRQEFDAAVGYQVSVLRDFLTQDTY